MYFCCTKLLLSSRISWKELLLNKNLNILSEFTLFAMLFMSIKPNVYAALLNLPEGWCSYYNSKEQMWKIWKSTVWHLPCLERKRISFKSTLESAWVIRAIVVPCLVCYIFSRHWNTVVDLLALENAHGSKQSCRSHIHLNGPKVLTDFCVTSMDWVGRTANPVHGSVWPENFTRSVDLGKVFEMRWNQRLIATDQVAWGRKVRESGSEVCVGSGCKLVVWGGQFGHGMMAKSEG